MSNQVIKIIFNDDIGKVFVDMFAKWIIQKSLTTYDATAVIQVYEEEYEDEQEEKSD